MLSEKELKNFLPVPGFSKYRCDVVNGRVYSLITNKWMTTKVNRDGYCLLHLNNDEGKREHRYLHWIVMDSMMGVKMPYSRTGYQVNHINRDGSNNCIDNLELLNKPSEQFTDDVKKDMQKKVYLTDQQKEWIIDNFYTYVNLKAEKGERVVFMDYYEEMADKFGCCVKTVQKLINRKELA